MILNVNFSKKSMNLNEKAFVKTILLNQKFSVSSDFELKIFRLVRLGINFSTTRQILT